MDEQKYWQEWYEFLMESADALTILDAQKLCKTTEKLILRWGK